jgi:hypothetical protein
MWTGFVQLPSQRNRQLCSSGDTDNGLLVYAEFVLSGYFKGKRRAEEALKATFPTGGVAIRPGFIYGTRYVSGVGVPLGAIGTPSRRHGTHELGIVCTMT